MNFYSISEIREIEDRCVRLGMNHLRMMENAGSAAARVIRERYDVSALKTVILCGAGGNGGDGFVVARKLSESGASITVLLVHGLPMSDTTKEMYSRTRDLNIKIIDCQLEPDSAVHAISNATLIVDAVYGIGFHGKLDDRSARIITAASNTNASKVALDIPSGINADTGDLGGCIISADLTVSFIGLKHCAFLQDSARYLGEVIGVSIGLPDGAFDSVSGSCSSIDKEFVKAVIPARPRHCHKGDFGNAVIISGSYGMCGASIIAAKAAVYTGAGLVTAIIPDCNYSAFTSSLPEAVTVPLSVSKNGSISSETLSKIVAVSEKGSAVLVGPGMGNTEETRHILMALMENVKVPLIIDADGINALSDCIDMIKTSNAEIIITPHSGEMARLLHVSVSDVESDRIRTAKSFADAHSCTVVLKGSHTIVADASGKVNINLTGNGGMAAAGSGDMLAGMITSLAAQGTDASTAAMAGVYLHAEAGDRAAAKVSTRSLTPSMMCEELPLMFLDYEAG